VKFLYALEVQKYAVEMRTNGKDFSQSCGCI
jgi:hypothetical protein